MVLSFQALFPEGYNSRVKILGSPQNILLNEFIAGDINPIVRLTSQPKQSQDLYHACWI